jgi:hypothetical protein
MLGLGSDSVFQALCILTFFFLSQILQKKKGLLKSLTMIMDLCILLILLVDTSCP